MSFDRFHAATLEHFEEGVHQFIRRLSILRSFAEIWRGYPDQYDPTRKLLQKEMNEYGRMLGSIIWA